MKTITRLTALALTVLAQGALAKESCVRQADIMRHAALVEIDGKGTGSGVFYQANILITNNSTTSGAKAIDVYSPFTGRTYTAFHAHSTSKPDIAIYELEEAIPNLPPLKLPRTVLKKEHMKLVSFPFSDKARLGAVDTRFNSFARFKSDTRLLYFNATLSDWAYGGDSGGGFFTCNGSLAGITLGNVGAARMPEHIYAINFRALEDALKKAGIKARRTY